MASAVGSAVKRSVASTIGPMTVGAMILALGWIGGTAYRWDVPTGSTSQSVLPLPAPTEDVTAAPLMVMVVSPTLTPTMIGYQPSPTKTPEPTETTIPPCIKGIATPERLCKETLPTWTPLVNTPIAVYGTGTPQVNALYFWPADE